MVRAASRDKGQADVDRLVPEIADWLRSGCSELIGGGRRGAVAAGRYVVGYVAPQEWRYPPLRWRERSTFPAKASWERWRRDRHASGRWGWKYMSCADNGNMGTTSLGS